MNAEPCIRRAAEKDIQDVLKLLVQVNMVHHHGRPDLFKGPTTKYSAGELEKLFQDETRPVFVYDDGTGHILGHAFCVHKQEIGDRILTDVKTLYIDDICVDENARGEHIGSKLYQHVIRYAKEHGFYNVTLNVWSCNPTAQRFYDACGMKPQKVGMEVLLSEID